MMSKMRHTWLQVGGWLGIAVLLGGCVAVPVPVSTVPLHPRQPAPAAVESAPTEPGGRYHALAFDADGQRLAAHDTGSGRVRLFDPASLAPLQDVLPVRLPRRLGFSPEGGWLVLQAHDGFISDHLAGRARPERVDIDAPEAMLDMIERVEVHGLRGEQPLVDLQCDEVHTVPPQGGWLWARRWAINPGARISSVLDATVSADDTTLTLLCEGGREQRWDLRTGARLADGAPPGFGPALRLAGSRTSSPDGAVIALALYAPGQPPKQVHLWDRRTDILRPAPGKCPLGEVPRQALSADGRRIVLLCEHGLGQAIRVWELDTARERPLKKAGFGLAGGLPVLRADGVAISPDGRHVAAALVSLMSGMVVSPLLPGTALGLERSDLRIWRVDDGREVAAIDIDDLVVHPTDALRGIDLAFSPDGRLLVLAGKRLRVFRWEDLTGKE
jgi:YD repeat-containing protein